MSNILGIDKTSDNITCELDADSIVYRQGGAVDMLGEGRRYAEMLIDQVIEQIWEDTGCNKLNIYLGTDTNYRIELATLAGYKANRKDKERPQYYDAIRAYLVGQHGAQLVYGEEAEDAASIACYQYTNYGLFVLGHIDKDLDMVSGSHYNYITRKFKFIDKVQALRNFYCQLVTGDWSVDNIPGIYNQLLISGKDEAAHKWRYSRYKKKLIAALDEVNTEIEMWHIVEELYRGQGIYNFNNIVEVGRLLWMRRSKGEMWIPPTDRTFDYIGNDLR